MGSTNKTTSLQLPQWIGTDKPTFLGDMNDAFLKIDNGYTDLSGEVQTASSESGNALKLATESKTLVTSLDSKVTTLDSEVKTASTTANSALKIANTANTTANNTNTELQNLVSEINAVEYGTLSIGTKMNKLYNGFVTYRPYLKMLFVSFLIDQSSSSPLLEYEDIVCKINNVPSLKITQQRSLIDSLWYQHTDSSGNKGQMNVTVGILDTDLNIHFGASTFTSGYYNRFMMQACFNTSNWN